MTAILRDREWTRADRDALPEDGKRYEILDGALLVTPSPAPGHQIVLMGLIRQLDGACPSHLRLLTAPLDVTLDERTILQPDLLVVRRDRIEDRGVRDRPELAVEILSPSTQRVDRTLKLERYQRAGTPAYWLADPKALTLTAYELVDGDLREVAHVTAGASWTATTPYVVTITPGIWLD
ncbi:MAG: Uma2 family endonuclease [Austwickia sp.]|nr:Uma2 family endonuclease [Actinomycetota bacterium]MCB1251644.1 Uma2 family endonuclease [Austwickia sp.]MCO5310943.1 Uma2 family endonuclease [Austwickia sp.]